MKLDHFTAWTQAVLSGMYLLFTFTIILIYELGWAQLATQSQEKTFDSMVNWMTGGALIVLYFWLQRAKGTTPDATATTITTTTNPPPAPQKTVVTTTPINGDTHETSTVHTAPDADDPERLRDTRTRTTEGPA